MKNVKFLMGVLAMGALALVACKKDNKDNKDMDNIAEDGFYVVGAATAVESVTADNAAKGLMGAGINEFDKKARAGLYEKYVALEGGKEFELVLKEGTAETHYGAELKENEPYDVDGGITINVLMGELKQNLKMSVPKSGFYHIALDLNKAGDLPNASIIVAPVEWQLKADASKKMTASEFNKEKMTWTLKDVEMIKGDWYKYTYGGGWKIKVTPAADVRIETNLGEDMKSGGENIKIAKSGKYSFELVWTLAGGAIEKNFTDNTKCTQEYEEKYPSDLYMIGVDFGNWNWEDAAVVTMVPTNTGDKDENEKPLGEGQFWTVRYLQAANGFKFCAKKAWEGDFTSMGANDAGFIVKDGNCFVDADGIYMILVDYQNEKIVIEPAKVYGIGDAFGGWDGEMETALFKAEGKTLVATTTGAGELRIYASSSAQTSSWWTREFMVLNGKIEYRGIGGDQERVPVTAGQKITLDFNAGTGEIK